MDDYEKRREERREEQRQYKNNVFYEVWRAGGNTDRIDYDRVNDNYWNQVEEQSAARQELNSQKPKPELPSEEEYFGLGQCEQCGENAWDGYICNNCGLKKI